MINRFKTRYEAQRWALNFHLVLYTIRKHEGFYRIYIPITENPLRDIYESTYPVTAQRLGSFKSRYYVSKWAKAYGITDYCIVSYRVPDDKDGLMTVKRYTIYVPSRRGISTDVYLRLMREAGHDRI